MAKTALSLWAGLHAVLLPLGAAQNITAPAAVGDASGSPVVAAPNISAPATVADVSGPPAVAAPSTSTAPAPVGEPSLQCRGAVHIKGYANLQVISTPYVEPGTPAGDVNVVGGALVPSMNGRAYLGNTCDEAYGVTHQSYTALPLLGKKFGFTAQMFGVGCGCKAAVYLTSLHQNSKLSGCEDYYCDASAACGVACAEIDIAELSSHAFRASMKTSADRIGVGTGYGGGLNEWNSSTYGPGGACIDTNYPFQVAASFPKYENGMLAHMEIQLSQPTKTCKLTSRIDDYDGNSTLYPKGRKQGMMELTRTLSEGMTPIMSFQRGNDMGWFDGKGADGSGPCEDYSTQPNMACPASTFFSNFFIEDVPDLPNPVVAAKTSEDPMGLVLIVVMFIFIGVVCYIGSRIQSRRQRKQGDKYDEMPDGGERAERE